MSKNISYKSGTATHSLYPELNQYKMLNKQEQPCNNADTIIAPKLSLNSYTQFDNETSSNSSSSNVENDQSQSEKNETRESKEMVRLYKELDDTIGHQGWYQILMLVTIMLGQITLGANAAMPIFTAAKPDYRCKTCFDSENSNFYHYSEQDIEDNFFKRNDDGLIDKCNIDVLVLPQNQSSTSSSPCCTNPELPETCNINSKNLPKSNIYQSCETYVYDDSFYKSTIITEFNLYCGRTYLADLSTTIYFAGYIFGYIISGPISSKFGRRSPAVYGILMVCLSSFYSTFAPNIENYIVSRFLVAVFGGIYITAEFNLLMENTGTKKRTLANILYGVGFSSGCAICSYPFALLLRNWRDLQLALSLLTVPVVLLFYLTLEESWRWLMSKDRIGEAQALAVKFYDKQQASNFSIEKQEHDRNLIRKNILQLVNLSKMDSNSSKNLKSSESQIQKYKKAFKYKTINKNTTILIAGFLTVNLVYYGLSLNAGNLPGDAIFNNAILSIMDFPGYLGVNFLMDLKILGRKNFLFLGFSLAGVFCILSTVSIHYGNEENYYDTIGQILAFTGKAFIGACFQGIYQHTTELYSTDIRAEIFGIMNFVGKVGATICPILIGLAEIYPMLPGLVFGICGVVSGFMHLMLPETLGMPLVMSVQELEKLFKSSR